MTTVHRFGGDWTEEKLIRLRKYLHAYTIIFDRNKQAQYLTTFYVDAFAGTGSRSTQAKDSGSTLALFDEDESSNIQSFYKGSAQVALDIEPSFDHYLFIDSNPAFVQELEALKVKYPDKANRIDVTQAEANSYLQRWCRRMDWGRNRAVVFLDPYGMAVSWDTVAALGRTRAIDLWVLLPLAQAINRMLPREGLPMTAWGNRLTAFFGTAQWLEAFYRPSAQPGLFDDAAGFEKQANFESIGVFFAERLKTVFPQVAGNSLMLMNSRNVPIFALYFAASDGTAVKIANHILGR